MKLNFSALLTLMHHSYYIFSTQIGFLAFNNIFFFLTDKFTGEFMLVKTTTKFRLILLHQVLFVFLDHHHMLFLRLSRHLLILILKLPFYHFCFSEVRKSLNAINFLSVFKSKSCLCTVCFMLPQHCHFTFITIVGHLIFCYN